MVTEFLENGKLTETCVDDVNAASDSSAARRQGFFNWLSAGNTTKYPAFMVINCFDRVSEYAIREKISQIDFWSITRYNSFMFLYIRILNDKLLRISDKDTYTTFAEVGRLYLKYLKAKPKAHSMVSPTKDTAKPDLTVKAAQVECPDMTQPVHEEPALTPMTSAFWNATIIHDFQAWLQSERYSNSSVRIYINLIQSALVHYTDLATRAEKSAETVAAAVHAFVEMLYDAINHSERLELAATLGALGALERFLTGSMKNNVALATSRQELSVSNDMRIIVSSILQEHFPNGIRPKSVIDANKLKACYNKITRKELAIDIPSLLNTIGILHGEKIFMVPTSGKRELADLLDRLLSEGNWLYYYDEFCNVHADLLQSMNVYSPDLLKKVLNELRPLLYYSRECFSVVRSISADSEILRCYQDKVSLAYEQIKEKLPYVPLEAIRKVLAGNRDFVLVRKGVYTHLSKIEFDERDRRSIPVKVGEEIANRGYIPLTLLDVSESLGLNPELSETAVKNGLFQVCLADRYEKRGCIITAKGTVLNSMVVCKDYCLSRDRVTLGELQELENAIYGRHHSWALLIACNTMVRTDKNTFVNESKIHFDADAIDHALSRFMYADVIPLQTVTSFTSFPYINGYPWNLFVLESFCRRFSKRYQYQCLAVNSRNVGAIFCKSAGFADYSAVLAAAVAEAEVRLDSKAVGDFLFENGYVAARTSVIQNVIAQARILRERRV